MLKVHYTEWNQTPECLLTQSIHAVHTRTRERFSALYQVAKGYSPVAVARKLGRRHDTVTGWINNYNRNGPDSMVYRRTGGRPSFSRVVSGAISGVIDQALELAASQERPCHFVRWTLKTLADWCYKTFATRFSRETLRQALKRHGYSWKKSKKLLNKADSARRAAFLEELKPLLEKATRQERLLVYIDEAHIHQDTDIGYGWSRKGISAFG